MKTIAFIRYYMYMVTWKVFVSVWSW